jgi:hypothetical protein
MHTGTYIAVTTSARTGDKDGTTVADPPYFGSHLNLRHERIRGLWSKRFLAKVSMLSL